MTKVQGDFEHVQHHVQSIIQNCALCHTWFTFSQVRKTLSTSLATVYLMSGLQCVVTIYWLEFLFKGGPRDVYSISSLFPYFFTCVSLYLSSSIFNFTLHPNES